jgi:hypothetical protein
VVELDVVHDHPLVARTPQKLGLVAKGVNCNSWVQQDLSWVWR